VQSPYVEVLKRELEEARKEMSDTTNDLLSLEQVTSTAIATLDQDELLDTLLKVMLGVLKGDVVVFLLKEHTTSFIRASAGIDQSGSSITRGISTVTAGSIAEITSPIYIENVHESKIFIPFIAGRNVTSIVGTPLRYGGELVGVLFVGWISPHPQTEREVALIGVAAERCTIALTNARLYNLEQESRARAELYMDLITHDTANLNTVAQGNIDLVLSRDHLEEKDKEKITRALEAQRSITNLIETVRKLQALEREETGCVVIDANASIERAVESVRALQEGGRVRINFNPAPDCMVVSTDLLSEVFRNLIENAIKHSRGPVTVDIKQEKVTRDEQHFWEFVVEDDGPGIPDEIKTTIFSRLMRGKTSASGRGLGLYLVSKLVKRCNGQVWVEDRVPGEYRKGARFVIHLPTVSE
jgi:signal transduction histidine kinase